MAPRCKNSAQKHCHARLARAVGADKDGQWIDGDGATSHRPKVSDAEIEVDGRGLSCAWLNPANCQRACAPAAPLAAHMRAIPAAV